MTHYVALIEDTGPDKAVGVVVPDLPGCFSAGETVEDAMRNAPEAIALWFGERDASDPAPRPRTPSEILSDPELARDITAFGYVLALIPAPATVLVAAE